MEMRAAVAGDGHREVAGAGHLDEQRAPAPARGGDDEREQAHQPVLVEVVVGHGLSHPDGGRRRPRYAKAISAERSAANSGGLPMPGQWDRQSSVPLGRRAVHDDVGAVRHRPRAHHRRCRRASWVEGTSAGRGSEVPTPGAYGDRGSAQTEPVARH